MDGVMERKPVKSSAIKSIGHDAEKNILEVEFHSGQVYQYHGFTADHIAEFQRQESIGGHFGKHIAGKFKHTKAGE
jgi:hypothetical protein